VRDRTAIFTDVHLEINQKIPFFLNGFINPVDLVIMEAGFFDIGMRVMLVILEFSFGVNVFLFLLLVAVCFF